MDEVVYILALPFLLFGFWITKVIPTIQDSPVIAAAYHEKYVAENQCTIGNTAYDIIQLDSGNKVSYTGKHVLNATETVSLRHGTDMASFLIDQLGRLTTKPTVNLAVFSGVGTSNYFETYFFQLRCILKSNVKVIAFSAGGDAVMDLEYDLMKKYQGNKLFVTAAGNDANPVHYPGDYDLPCIIKVATVQDHKSVYGSRGEVYWPLMDRKSDGTSASTARFAAVALDYWRQHPKLTCSEVERDLKGLYGKL